MEEKNKRSAIIRKLAETIGVEEEDIGDDDNFSEDLHMNALELSDFVHSLSNLGYDTAKLNLAEIETVSDLLEALGTHAEI